MQRILQTLLATVLLLGVNTLKAKEPGYTLPEAIKKNLVRAEIKGSDTTFYNSSGHYGKCIMITLTNLTGNKITVRLETGQQLLPDDTTIQNMMVTEQQLFVMGPNKKSKKYINAMCVQQHDGGPGKKIKFTMGQMSPAGLLGIAQLIEKHQYFNSTAQTAVWCISDGENINAIQNSEDTVMTYVLQKYVSEATGQPMPVRNSLQTKAQPQRHSKTTVTFEWTVQTACKTTLVVLNMDNQPVMEVLKDASLPAGTHSYAVELSTATLPEGEYKIVLYLNNRVQMSRKVKLGR